MKLRIIESEMRSFRYKRVLKDSGRPPTGTRTARLWNCQVTDAEERLRLLVVIRSCMEEYGNSSTGNINNHQSCRDGVESSTNLSSLFSSLSFFVDTLNTIKDAFASGDLHKMYFCRQSHFKIIVIVPLLIDSDCLQK